MSSALALETRGLHALAREKAVDRFAVDAEDAPNAHGVEPAVVDQAPNRLGMHAELGRDLTDADQASGLSAYRRHNPSEASQVSEPPAWANRTNSPAGRTYPSRRRRGTRSSACRANLGRTWNQ